MDLELKEKIALVTGASGGIGRAIARGLAAEGARVALCARDKATLETAAAEIARETRAEPFIVAGDLSRLEEVERAAREVHRRFGRIDILVNNAGAIRGGDFLTIPDAQWADDWSLKLLGYIRVARAVFPLMRAQGGGRIINVVGAAARNPTTGYLPGGVANAGLGNFTKGLDDLGPPHGILVTAVSGLSGDGSSLSVTPGAADHLTLTSNASSVVSGAAKTLTAELRDANGNLETADNTTAVT